MYLWGVHRLQVTVGQSHHQKVRHRIHIVRERIKGIGYSGRQKSKQDENLEALGATGCGRGKIKHRLR